MQWLVLVVMPGCVKCLDFCQRHLHIYLFCSQKVNYAGIAGSDEFKKFCKMVSLLQRVDLAELSREEKLAFFVNIYNAQVVHANVVAGPPQNLWQRYKVNNEIGTLFFFGRRDLTHIEISTILWQIFRPNGLKLLINMYM